MTDALAKHSGKRPLDPFKRAVLRGLGVLLPPLLTIVIFLWVGNTVARYLLEPVEQGAKYLLVEYASDIRSQADFSENAVVEDGKITTPENVYEEVETGDDAKYIPAEVLTEVRKHLGNDRMPDTAEGIYDRYMQQRWLQRRFVIPIFVGVFVLLMYLLGKFLAAGIGRFFWSRFERIIDRVPLVRNVYSSVKQVTDFLFTDPDLEYTRVVAVEYPRKGIWTVAFVTGESMLDIESAANEPVMSVLIPTSPMPFTGFTITVKKSETVDLDLTIDQAFQFVVSCGVVVPPQQLTKAMSSETAGQNGQAQLPSDVMASRDSAGQHDTSIAARTISDDE